MTVGAFQFNCPECNNPLFATFRIEEAMSGLRRTVDCPGCRATYNLNIRVEARK